MSRWVVAVTANPSLDRTLHVAALTRGAVHRASAESLEPSGKGVNVALALHRVGAPATAVLPVGGPAGNQLLAMLAAIGLPHAGVPIEGVVRSNVTLVEADGTTTKINEAGPRLSSAEVDQLLAATLMDPQHRTAAVAPANPGWIAWCGSLPAGFSPQRLADAVADARQAGRFVALDTSGDALRVALAQPADRLPDLIKPNVAELADITDRSLRRLGDVADAAMSLVHRGVGCVLVSLGPDGALLASEGVVLHGVAPVARVVNTAGAGDALLAGYLAADLTVDPEDLTTASAQVRLAGALRFGAATVQHGGTLFPGLDPTQPVTIRPAQLQRPLLEPA